MNDIVSALGLHGVPELFRRPYDLDHYRGEKAVIAFMASDRTHPEFKKAEAIFGGDQEGDNWVLITEDHADGPLHARFQCGPQEFCFALQDKAGHVVLRMSCTPEIGIVQSHLAAEADVIEENDDLRSAHQ